MILGAHRLWSIWLYSDLAYPLKHWMHERGGKIAYLSGCPFCLSVWAGFIALILWLFGFWGQMLLWGLTAGAGVLVTEVLLTKLNKFAMKD